MTSIISNCMKLAVLFIVTTLFIACGGRGIPQPSATCTSDAECNKIGSGRSMCVSHCVSKNKPCDTYTPCSGGQECSSSGIGICVFTKNCKESSDCNADSAHEAPAAICDSTFCIEKLCTKSESTECKGDNPSKGCFTCTNGQKCQFENSAGKDHQSPICVMDKPTTIDCTDGETKSCYSGKASTKDVGVCKAGWQTCKNGTWNQTCVGEVLPAKEICNDKLDNNCDGNVNEVSVCGSEDCNAGDSRPCYTGEASTQGVGQCKAGKQSCKDGKWNDACDGEVLPSKEICKDKIDNDCNNKTDELEECKTPQGDCKANETRECYKGPANTAGTASCKKGSQTCSKLLVWGECIGEVLPGKEICDSKDNDCNGKTDELPECTKKCKDGDKRDCYTGDSTTKGVGECSAGKQTCKDEKWGSCEGETLPSNEICDGKDNNCDGSKDESLMRSCYSGNSKEIGVGLCKTGMQACSNGQWETTCKGEIIPTNGDKCDGFDNNCDGSVDENHPLKGKSCSDAKLPNGCITPGTQQCTPDGSGVTCKSTDPNRKIKLEDCTNGIDDDCNGKIDDGANCPKCKEKDVRSCFDAKSGCVQDKITKNWSCKGHCKAGAQTCTNGNWSVCVGQKLPSKEVCDGKDNNCSGKADDQFADLNKVCDNGQGGSCKVTGTMVCSTDKTKTECSAKPKPTSPEVCDGVDNNCDGKVDETFTDLGDACNAGKGICKNTGKMICSQDKSKTVCDAVAKTASTAETCNGKDDDCDGQTDEDFKTLGNACTNGQFDCKVTGKMICAANGVKAECDAQAKTPGVETCNGKDDDCDGKTDEGVSASCLDAVTVDLKDFTMGPPGQTSLVKFPHKEVSASQMVTNLMYKTITGKAIPVGQLCTKDNCPVTNVRWHDAAKYANLLSAKHSFNKCYTCTVVGTLNKCVPKDAATAKHFQCNGFRLMGTAEWEFLASGNTTGGLYGKIDDIAWHNGNSSSTIHEVRQKLPTSDGLYDMYGNVLCMVGYYSTNSNSPLLSTLNTSQRQTRGCAYNDSATKCKVYLRRDIPISALGSKMIGFRLIRTTKY